MLKTRIQIENGRTGVIKLARQVIKNEGVCWMIHIWDK